MKNIKYYLSVLLIVFAVNSCDVLDEDPFTQPSTENFYQNETDALSASKIETQSSRDDERLKPCPEIAASHWSFAY